MSITSPLGKSLVPQSVLNMICPKGVCMAWSCCWPFMGKGCQFLLETLPQDELDKCYPQLKGIKRTPVRQGGAAYQARRAQLGARLRAGQALARSTARARRDAGRAAFDAQLAATRARASGQRTAAFAAIRSSIRARRQVQAAQREADTISRNALIAKLKLTATPKSLAAAARLEAQARTWEAERLAREAATDAKIDRQEAAAIAAAAARYAAADDRISQNRAAADAARASQQRQQFNQQLQQQLGGPPAGIIQRYTVDPADITEQGYLCPPGRRLIPIDLLIEQQRSRAIARARVFGRPTRRRAIQLASMAEQVNLRIAEFERRSRRLKALPLPPIVPVGRCPAVGEVFAIRDGMAEWRGGGTVIVRQGGTREGVVAKFKEWGCPYTINLTVGG